MNNGGDMIRLSQTLSPAGRRAVVLFHRRHKFCFWLLLLLFLSWFGSPAGALEWSETRVYLDLDYIGDIDSVIKSPKIPELNDLSVFMSEMDSELSWLLPPLDRHGSTLEFSVESRWLVVDYDSRIIATSGRPEVDNTYYLGLDTTYRGRYGRRWGVQADFQFGVASDLATDYSSDWWALEGSLLLLYSLPPGWTLGLGGGHTFVFGKPYWTPFLLVEYDQGELWTVDVLLPERAEAWYKLWKGFQVGLACRAWGMRYARNSVDFPGLASPFLTQSQIDLGGGIAYEFDKRFHLGIEGGYTLRRVLRILDGRDTLVSLDLENGPFIRAYVRFGGGF